MKGHVWQQEEVAKLFLEGVRGAIPLAAVQMDMLLRIVRKTLPKIDRILDLGCGDGILGRAVLAEYPQASGMFLDFSDPMIEAARRKAAEQGVRATFMVQDFGAKDWVDAVADQGPFDLVLSGFAIHHLPDDRKRELYREIFGLLEAGRPVLEPGARRLQRRLGQRKCSTNSLSIPCGATIGNKVQRSRERPSPTSGTIGLTRTPTSWPPSIFSARWLEEIGFVDVDCFFKVFELALFGGRRPLPDEPRKGRS